jgi:16S rRNA (guanine966-N2)-methyltransferase
MRILSGQFRGKKLFAGNDFSIRPTTGKIKEIIFSILGDFFTDIEVLDLFSGSGSLGFETLSRGAKHVTFVEKERSSINVLEKNLASLSVDSHNISIVRRDVLEYLKICVKQFELILMDPPFRYPHLQVLVTEIMAGEILKKTGILVVHHEIDNPLATDHMHYQVIKQKKIGRSLVSFILPEEKNV